MRRKECFTMFLTIIPAASAYAAVTFLATGTLTASAAGNYADLSELSSTLENGLPSNVLGGVGSGLAYAGGDIFLALPDRGPNANSYNSKVDDTVSYISRFHTLKMKFSPSASGSKVPLVLNIVLEKTTLLSSKTPLVYGDGAVVGLGSGVPARNNKSTYYFTGRPDNFDPKQSSGNPANARLDPESIRVSNTGRYVFISDEYGPYLYEFDRATGQRLRSFMLPSNLDVSHLSPMGKIEISGNTSGRVANKGMEGLAITPDGKMLVGVMQAPLIQDEAIAASKKLIRLVTIDIATGMPHEFGYMLTEGSGVSEIIAVNNHEFLVDERDGAGLGDGTSAIVKMLFKIDLAAAKDITNLPSTEAAAAAVSKSPFLDIVSLLTEKGVSAKQIPAKIEGISFGPDTRLNGVTQHTLFVANDNDFIPETAGPNQFFVFGFVDADLPGFAIQQFTPQR